MELILLGTAQPLHLAKTEVEIPGFATGLYFRRRIRHQFGRLEYLARPWARRRWMVQPSLGRSTSRGEMAFAVLATFRHTAMARPMAWILRLCLQVRSNDAEVGNRIRG